MSTLQWAAPEAPATALSTDLNSLANGSLSAASAAIDNSTGRYAYMTLELVLASLTPGTGGYCLCYLIKSQDGTNYEDFVATSKHCVAASFPLSTTTGAKRIIVAHVVCPPTKFKLGLENQSGVALASSGNTLNYARYAEEIV